MTISHPPNCSFCAISEAQIVLQNADGIVFRDRFPISPGHTLVVPRCHVGSLFELPTEAQLSLWQLVADARRMLLDEFHPNGFNVGINDGNAAGQTVGHAHIHVIPRFDGDVNDPRGGVRWVIPSKAVYWSGS